MASTETKILDDIIASRRAMILGGSALAGLLLTKQAKAAATVTSYTDADILNFALNTEYLEANFYYLAAFGTTIDVANAASMAAGAPVISLKGTVGVQGATVTAQGTVAHKPNPQVPFALPAVAAYAVETAIVEAGHVAFLLGALGSAAVAQPAIDLTGGAAYGPTAAWNALATAAGINGGVFDPFASDAFYLLASYVFEDVGVTAYHGAAPLLTNIANVGPAAGILAAEAYLAGNVRTALNSLDPTGAMGYVAITTQISALRAKLSLAANGGMNLAGGTTPDDVSIAPQTVNLGGTSVQASQIVNADANVLAFARNTTQVLNIVTGGGATVAGTPAKGVFFPNGLNGTFI